MATAAIVALRQRQEMDGGAETAEPLLVDDDALRRLVRVQATFRGARSRRKVQQQQRWHAGASGVMIMVPVRAAARVIRESAVRRHGNRALLLYIVFLILFAAMLLDGSNQEGAFMLKDGVKRRLGAVKTKDGRTYSECLTLEDIGYWVPAAAASLTSVSDSELSSMNSLSPEQMAALVAGGSMPPSPSGLGAAPAPPGGRPAATTNLTGNMVTGAMTMMLTADDGSVYLPPIGLVMQYNRIVPALQIRTRRRRVSYGGCGSAGGGDGWLRTCWYDDDDASPWVGSVTNTTYVQSNGAFGFDWPLGFPPMPPGLQNTRWLALMQDGWLGDRTLDVQVSMIFLNTNTNLIGMATLTWTLHLSGAITSELTSFAVPLSSKPTKANAQWWRFPLRLSVLVLLLSNWWVLIREWQGRAPSLFHPRQMEPTQASCALSCAGKTPGRLRKSAAATHVGALCLITAVMAVLIIGDVLSGFTLPDPKRLLLSSSEGEVRLLMGIFMADMRRFEDVHVAFNAFQGFAWVVATARLVRLLDFDPRLSLISRTVSNAGSELSFFLLSSFLTLMGFSLAGSVMFGTELRGFLSPRHAILTLMGGVDGLLEGAAVVSGTTLVATVYYWGFVVVIVVLFLNIAVAILVDSYVSIKEVDKRKASDEKMLVSKRLRQLVNELTRDESAAGGPCQGGCHPRRLWVGRRQLNGRYSHRHSQAAILPQAPAELGLEANEPSHGTLAPQAGEADEFSFLDETPAAPDAGVTGNHQLEESAAAAAAAATAASPQPSANGLHKMPPARTRARSSDTSGMLSRSGLQLQAGKVGPVGLESLCRLLDELGHESTSDAEEEAWIDSYELSLRLARLGAPRMLARELCHVFGRMLPRDGQAESAALKTSGVARRDVNHDHHASSHGMPTDDLGRGKTLAEVVAKVAVELELPQLSLVGAVAAAEAQLGLQGSGLSLKQRLHVVAAQVGVAI